ncbi:hypothetical protein [Acidocella sp. KAb 2-4]|uniref:hypothetical protein n=1 Tax=Acidocella sp. KAb 2-4 TaxID=2885158 RepID=UPI001D064170|nr:hypothetical protein [Acidocella sp. KAb 2-4]MCB5945934.1 hypothetical protein [Acidocella sp. KAb 2-4]
MNFPTKKICAAMAILVASIFLGAIVFPYQGGDDFDPWVRFTFQLAVGMPIVFSLFSGAKSRPVFFCCVVCGLPAALIVGFGFSLLISAASQSILMDFEEDFLQIVAILIILFLSFKIPQECAQKLNDNKTRSRILWGNEEPRKKPLIGLVVAYIVAVFGSPCIALAVSTFTISGIENLFFPPTLSSEIATDDTNWNIVVSNYIAQNPGKARASSYGKATNSPEGALYRAAWQVGRIAQLVVSSLPEAATGAVVGAVAGVPMSGIGAIPGAVGGAAAGFTVGMIGYARLQTEGAQEAQYDSQ